MKAGLTREPNTREFVTTSETITQSKCPEEIFALMRGM